MKFKKLLCIFVCVFVVLGGVIFASCGKKHYDLKNLVTDYGNFSYSKISFDAGRYNFNFNDKLENGAYKNELNEIVILNNNLSAFLADNIALSNQKANSNVSNSNRDKVKDCLNDVNNSLAGVNEALNVLTFRSDMLGNADQRESLKSFYNSFESAVYKYFVALSNLSNVYADIYFGSYMKDENVNYYKQYAENKIDIDSLSNRYVFNARVGYQIFNTSQIYLVEKWNTQNQADYNQYNTVVSKLNDCKLDINQKFADNEQTKSLAVKLYNAIALMQNDYNSFVAARSVLLNGTDVDYELDNSLSVFNNYKQKVYEYNNILIDLHNQAQ